MLSVICMLMTGIVHVIHLKDLEYPTTTIAVIASVLANFPTFPMELAQQKLVYIFLAAFPMEICFKFNFFPKFCAF